ncbi:MAG: hypothetical protein ACOZAR_02735 [Patescibacteria group bacterium]
MRIKRRLNGGIREIYLWSKDNEKMFIGGFEDDFEEVKFAIEKKISKEIIQEEKELVDYDHWFFYPFLGIVLGVLGMGFMALLLRSNDNVLSVILFMFFVFVFLLSSYFIFCKPISSRQGKRGRIIDYVIGAIMFSGCVYVLFVCWKYY